MKKLTQDDRRIAIGPSRSKNLHSGLAKYDTITAKYQYGWWARSQKYTTCICPSILRKHHLESSTGQINHSFYPNPSPSGLSLIFPAGGLILLGFYFIFLFWVSLLGPSDFISYFLRAALSVCLSFSISLSSLFYHSLPPLRSLSLSLSLSSFLSVVSFSFLVLLSFQLPTP